MLSQHVERELRDIHLQLTLLNQYFLAARDRGFPVHSDEIGEVEERLNLQKSRIYEILDPDTSE